MRPVFNRELAHETSHLGTKIPPARKVGKVISMSQPKTGRRAVADAGVKRLRLRSCKVRTPLVPEDAHFSVRANPRPAQREGWSVMRNLTQWNRPVVQRGIWFVAALLLVAACSQSQNTGSSTTASTTSTARATDERSVTQQPIPTSVSVATPKSPPRTTTKATQPPHPAPKPVPRTTTRATQSRPSSSAARNCDPAYPDVCLHDGIGDYDCAGGSGNGPNYVSGPIRVLPPDPFDLDRDGDGIGCE
jgi:hypothetical protein